MTINWFPGHMTRASRQISEAVKQVDMIIELRDSRIPLASENPLFDSILINKPRLIVLTKSDLADTKVTSNWIEYLSAEDKIVIALDLYHDNLNIVTEKCQLLLKDKTQRQLRKGIKPRAIRAMIVGIPNVGKSTLINRLTKRKVLKVADQPGITRALKWVKVNEKLDLLDTPGVLWPKLESDETALLLAVTGAISDKVLDLQRIACFAYDYLYQNYRNILFERYGELPKDNIEGLQLIGERRKFYQTNQEIDEARTYNVFMDEIRGQHFKGVTWQKIPG